MAIEKQVKVKQVVPSGVCQEVRIGTDVEVDNGWWMGGCLGGRVPAGVCIHRLRRRDRSGWEV